MYKKELFDRLNALKDSQQAFILSGLFGLIFERVDHNILMGHIEKKVSAFEKGWGYLDELT